MSVLRLPLTELYLEVTGKIAAGKAEQRFRRQRMLEDEIVHHRPDYNEAMELLDSLHAALEARFNDNLGPDLEHCFKCLREALNAADDAELRRTYEPEAYDSIGMAHDDLPYEEKE